MEEPEKETLGCFVWDCGAAPFSHRASMQSSASTSQLARLRLRLFDVNGAMNVHKSA